MQLQFDSIVRQSFKVRAKHIRKYVKDNKTKYRKFALKITPDRTDPAQVWDRIAFAILSANVGFEQGVRALKYASGCKGKADSYKIMKFGMVPRKAEYLNLLPLGPEIFKYLKEETETWNEYRLRLKKDILGLGLAKASFTACLLYPLDADLGCVDTHICKIYLNLQAFKTLSLKKYMRVEQKIRAVASRFKINTFLAQWLIWDHTRRMVSDHDIFPGSHKTDETFVSSERKAA